MDSESIVEQLVRNLSFEIETATQNNPVRLKNKSKSTPLNVKVRVRKKNKTPQYGIVSVPKVYIGNEKIRLANSDQTVMSFDLIMEPDSEKGPVKKHRRKLIEILKQGTCLGTTNNEEDFCYLPSSSHKQTLKVQSVTSESNYLLKQPTTLLKRNYMDSSSTNHNILGKCKPGGCLDPPFNEDKYPYTPTIEKLFVPTRKSMKTNPNIVKHNSSVIRIKTENTDLSTAANSIMNEQKDNNLILKLYEAGSVNTSLSTAQSNSIITYPPTLTSSECRTYNGKDMHNNINTEVNKNTVNQLYDAYYMPSKRVVKLLDKTKAEITNLAVEKDSILNNNLAQNKMRNSTHLSEPTFFDIKVEGGKINSKTESVKINQQLEKAIVKEVSYRELKINEVQGASTSVLNERLLAQDNNSYEHNTLLQNEIKMDLPDDIYKSYGSNTSKMVDIDLPRQSVGQILEPNNHYSSSTHKNLNTDGRSKTLAGDSNSVLRNIDKANITLSEKSLVNLKIIKKASDVNSQKANEELSNVQNTTESKEIIELSSENQHVKDISHDDCTSSISFVSKTNVFYEHDKAKVIKASLESNELINPNDRCYDTNLNDLYKESKENSEKNILLKPEKVEGVTTSGIQMQDSESDEKNDLSPQITIIHAANSSINNTILSQYSILSVNERSVETIYSISQTRYISIDKISLLENKDSAEDKSNINDINRSKLDYVPNAQVSTHISELSVNKEKEICLEDDIKMHILNTTQIAKTSSELSIKMSPTQQLDTELFIDKSRTTNLKYNSFDSSVLIDIRKLGSSHEQSFFDEKSFSTGSLFSVHNDETPESDKETQLTNHGKYENDTNLNPLPQKDEIVILNSLPKSNSQLNPLTENCPLLVIQPHKMIDKIYEQKLTIKPTPTPFVIDNISDHKPDIRDTSRIYADKQLPNNNLVSSFDKIKDELVTSRNKNSKTYVSSNITDTTDLQVLETRLQKEYTDLNNVNMFENDLATISRISLNQSRQMLNVNNKNNELSLDLAFQIYCNKKNQRCLRSLSSEHEPQGTHDTFFKLKTGIRTSNYKFIIPIDTKTDLSIHIDNANDRSELPRSIVNKGTQITEQIQYLNNVSPNKTMNELEYNNLLYICEKELIPLQMAIKSLKTEIDSFAEQPLTIKNNLHGINKSKLIRFPNVGKRCGCFKNYF